MSLRAECILVGVWLLASAGCTAAPGNGAAPLLRSAVQEDVTPLATPTDFPPTPTETLPPAAELPTPELTLPGPETWSDAPTYSTESTPGFNFQVSYDGSLWALTEDEMGRPALVYRQIPYCQMVPTAGRGVPRGWTTDTQFRPIGSLQFEVDTVSQNGIVQYLNYYGGDGTIQTGFQVSFQEQQDDCLLAAETVLASLGSTPAPLSTPTLAPTTTETAWPTPTGTDSPTP
jgi:hypothetical protein